MNRRAARRQQRARGGQTAARSVPVPLPLKGLFVEAENAEIAAGFASQIKNFRSTGVKIDMRSQASYLTETSAVLQRLPFEFNGASVTVEVRAGEIVAMDAAGTTIDTIAHYSNGRASWAYISGQIVIASGFGLPILFDGTTFSEMSWTTPAGVNAQHFNGVIAHHDRLYFWIRDSSLDFYYGDVGAVTGTLTAFPFGRLGSVTGSMSSMLSFTVDAGQDTNDVLCIITTTGHMVLYQGLDPGDASDWGLVSRVKGAAPVSSHAAVQVGSDLWMVTTSGLISVRATISNGVLGLISEVSRPIARQITQRIQTGGAEWQAHVAADGSQVIINRQPTTGAAEQWIYEVESRTWDTADYPARFWYNLGAETLFTATDGRKAQLLRQPTGTETITATWHSGWFRLPGKTSITSLTPTIIASGALSVSITVLSDHDTTTADIAEATQTVTVEPDAAGDSVALNETIGCDAVGEVFQIRMEVSAKWAELVSLQIAAR